MKNIIISIMALMLLTASAFAGQGYTQFSTGGNKFLTSAATNYVVITDDSKNGGDPVVTYVNATSDLTSAVLQWYNTTNAVTCSLGGTTNPTSTTFYVNSTNGFVAGDLLVIEHLYLTNSPAKQRFYEVNSLASTALGTIVATNIVYSGGTTGTTTNYTYTMTLAVASAVTNFPGDNVYQLNKTGVGFLPVYTNAAQGNFGINLYSAGGIYSGNRGKPLVGILNGTSAATINSVSAVFVP